MNPSRIWRAVLRFCLPSERRDDIDADLIEEFQLRGAEASPRAARRWYRRQTLGFLTHRVGRVAGDLPANIRRCHPGRWLSVTDLKVGARLAARQPMASITSILTLATAIGLALLGFWLARGLAWPELPIEGGDRMYQVRIHEAEAGRVVASPEEVMMWVADAHVPEDVGAFEAFTPPIQIADEAPRPIEGARVTPGPFARIAPAPLLGRHLTEADALPGAQPVVVLREYVWQHPRAYAGDPDILGSDLSIAGVPHTIVGVLPDAWGFPTSHSLWVPLSLGQAALDAAVPDGELRTRNIRTWVVLEDPTELVPATQELSALALGARVDREGPDRTVTLVPYIEAATEGAGTPVALVITAFFVAILGGVALNVSTLVLARCAQRSEELAVRSALGAPRARLLSQMFSESFVLSAIAATIGTLAAVRVLGLIIPFVDQDMPFWMNLSMGRSDLITAALLAVLVSSVAGVLPALRVTARRRVANALQSKGGAASLGRGTGAMLSTQLAVSVAVLTVSALLLEGFAQFTGETVVTEEEKVLTVLLRRDPLRFGPGARGDALAHHQYRTEIESALAAIPGADQVALASSLPRVHGDMGPLELESTQEADPTRHLAQLVRVGPGFLELMGSTALQGRLLDADDARPGARRVAVVSESFVVEVLGGRSPLGRRVRLGASNGSEPEWVEIVGLVPDLEMAPGSRTVRGEIYFPLVGDWMLYATIRTSGDPVALAPGVRHAVAEVESNILVTDMQTLPDVGWEIRAGFQGGSAVLAVVGVLVLLLSLAGVYALASLAVTRRTREIGIRVALGASSRSVLRTVLRQTALQLGTGLMGGAALAFALARATVLLPVAIPGSLALALPVVALLMALAGVAAAWIPARRALAVDPMEALRTH
ncbi:MAG: FtsX-like permease family protein [Acidobacteria bacterium]|nr:FtsX-like permease family protein [Acidobacteriota bacterium]